MRSYLLSWTLLMKMIFHLWIQRQALHRGSKNQILNIAERFKMNMPGWSPHPQGEHFITRGNPSFVYSALFKNLTGYQVSVSWNDRFLPFTCSPNSYNDHALSYSPPRPFQLYTQGEFIFCCKIIIRSHMLCLPIGVF